MVEQVRLDCIDTAVHYSISCSRIGNTEGLIQSKMPIVGRERTLRMKRR
jgi:hypothetical protein